MELWMAGCAELRANLPPDVEAALTRHEEAGTVSAPEYLAATNEFYARHLSRVVPMPQDLIDTLAQMEAEPTVYYTMNGPNEFHVLGTLRGWSIIDRLPRITAPTLMIAGEFDEATPAARQPYVDHIAGTASHVFPDTSHCSHLDKPESSPTSIPAVCLLPAARFGRLVLPGPPEVEELPAAPGCADTRLLIIGYVLFNADDLAKIGGLVWLGIGAAVFLVNKIRGRGVPALGDETAARGEGGQVVGVR